MTAEGASGHHDADAARILVWYAEGIVISELQCSSDEARSLMIELAGREGVTLESIACAVVQRSLTSPLDEAFSKKRQAGEQQRR
jgi:hypothetical protein